MNAMRFLFRHRSSLLAAAIGCLGVASIAAADSGVATMAQAAPNAPAGGAPGGFPGGGFPGGAGGFPGGAGGFPGGAGGFPGGAGGFPGFGGGDGIAPWLKDRLPPADSPKPSPDPRNLEGSYLNFKMGMMGGGGGPDYTDEYKAKASQFMALSNGGRPTADLPASCRPAGQVQAFNANFPFVVIQSDKYVLLLQEESHSLVRIHMNKPLPKSVKTSYEGYSVGRWEGDTLVTETIGIDDRTHLGMIPVKHSADLHLVTKIRKTEKGDLEFTWIATDPKAFKTPYKSGPVVHTWAPNVNQLSEYDCEEQMGSKDYATRYGMKEEK